MKKIMLLSAVMGSLISANTFAHNIQPNQLLANVTVSDKGEITLNGNDVAYKSWSSTALPGKVRVIQHIAGRSAAKEKNQAMIEAIKAAHFNQAKYQTTTIINADDAVVGTGMFVKSSAEKGKKENAHSQVILDDKSAVKNTLIFNRTFMFKLRITSEYTEVWCAFFVKRVTTFLTFFSHIEQHGCVTRKLL